MLVLRLPPSACKRCNPIIRAREPQDPQVSMQLFYGAALLAPSTSLSLKPAGELRRIAVELALPVRFRYLGSAVPSRSYLRMVLRESFVRRAISRIDNPSRRRQRLITLNIATSITPASPAPVRADSVYTWSNFDANHPVI